MPNIHRQVFISRDPSSYIFKKLTPVPEGVVDTVRRPKRTNSKGRSRRSEARSWFDEAREPGVPTL
jgi:hypothetical protein